MIAELNVLRNATRAAARIAHLNNCGASLPPDVVVDSVIAHLKLEEEHGPYEAAAMAGDRTTAMYNSAAKLIGCDPSEIAFCDSASRAFNVLVYSLPLQVGDRILLSPLEFGSCLIALQHVAERSGAVVEILPSDREGRVVVDSLQHVLSQGKPPALVAITHAAAHCGSVNQVREIGKLVKSVGAFYVVDACQSLGQMHVSVDEIMCDALTATGRKWLRGPRGTGFLFVKKGVSELIDPVTSDLVTADYLLQSDRSSGSRLKIRADARRFELWERSVATCIGLGVAIEYLLHLISNAVDVYGRIIELSQYAADQLRTIRGIDVWAPSRVQSGVIGFLVRGYAPIDVKTACTRRDINISTMAAYDAPLDFHRRGADTVCRVAAHYFNEVGEIDKFIHALSNLVP